MSVYDNTNWRVASRPRRWKPGMRVIAFRNLNGRDYRRLYPIHRNLDTITQTPSGNVLIKQGPPVFRWMNHTKTYHGTLIKNEWRFTGTVFTIRYTVRCDDGKVRKFQILKEE